MKLNLGCGKNKKEGYINIDIDKSVNPDKILDLNQDLNHIRFRYANEVEHIQMFHLLEHLDYPRKVLNELKKILMKKGTLHIKVPYYNYITAYGNYQHKHYFGRGWFESYAEYNNWKIKDIKYNPSIIGKFIPFRKYVSYFLGSIIKEIEVILEK